MRVAGEPQSHTRDGSTVGLIADIERFALHDGPGIRTLVFLKGCPLGCLWCSSPHTRRGAPELLYDRRLCSASGRCVEVCPQDAITLAAEGGIEIDRELCDGCGDCVEVCPSGALELSGRLVTAPQLLEEVTRDEGFYRRSGGGVTLGGGEPTAQAEFAVEFLRLCKRRFLHTAMETCGHVEWSILDRLLDTLDLVYMDIKHMDEEHHRRFTGVSNRIILANVERTAGRCQVILRLPVIPGFNDSEENVIATARFAASLGDGCRRLELLPYHRLGIDHYRRLGEDYALEGVEPPGPRELEKLRSIAEACGVDVLICG
jgi:pyruvate formate lyase activating enzyme